MADRSVVYRIQADVTQARAQIASLSASVKKSADDMTAATKQGAQFRAGLDQVGRSAGLVGAVAAAGLGAAVVKAANFDQAMSNVQAATHETAGNMSALREAALDAGQATVFSATEAAAGIENLAKAGVSTRDILGGGLAGALDLAAAGELEVAQASEIAATALTQFNLKGSDVGHVADLLAAGAGKAQGEVSDLGMAMNQSGLIASQMGVSIEETVGTLSAFASAGLLGSDAGTSFKTMLLRLANPSKDAAEAMSEFGISAYDANGEMVSMTDLAGQLSAAFANQDQATRDAALATIFGSDAIRAANVLYSQGSDGIAQWTANVDQAGYAAETAAIRMDNLKGDWEELTGALETAFIGTGDGSQGILRDLTQGATKLVNAYNDLPGAAQSAVGGIAAVTAVAGGSIFVGSKLVTGIADTRQALADLGVNGAKATKAMKGVAVAGAGLAILGAAGAGVAALAESLDEVLPGLEGVKSGLIAIANEPDENSIRVISGEFDSLGKSIDRLTAKTDAQRGDDFLAKLLPGEAKGFREATAEIQAIDDALASLVATGHADIAAQALERLAAAPGVSSGQYERLIPLLGNYNDALAGQANDATLAATATTELGAAMGSASAMTAAQAEALKKAREAARATAGQFFNLGDSLDDASVSLGDWINEMSKQAAALRNFTKNAETAADRGLRQGLINALREAGPEGAMRMQQLANASDKEIGRANRAWRNGQQAIDQYVDSIHKADVPDITNRVLTIFTTRRVNEGNTGMGPQPPGAADGTTVPKTGRPYADRHLYLLADGEEVVSNRHGQADRHRPLLKAISAGRLADGGTTGKRRASLGISGVWSGGEFTSIEKASARAAEAIERWTGRVADSESALSLAQNELSAWGQRMEQVGESVVSRFDPQLFERPSNIWSTKSSDPFSALGESIAGLAERQSLQQALAAAGLSEGAFAAVGAQGGNEDLAALLASGRVGEFQAQYEQYEALRQATASSAGQMAYGERHDAAAQRVVELTAVVQRMEQQLAAAQLTDERIQRAAELIAKANSTPAARGGLAGGRRKAG